MAGQGIRAGAGRRFLSRRAWQAVGLVAMFAAGAWAAWHVYSDYRQRQAQRQQVAECGMLKAAGKFGLRRYEYLGCDGLDAASRPRVRH